MPTTIEFPVSFNTTRGLHISKPDPLNDRIGFGISMRWALLMLAIGAAAHFGTQASDCSAFELLALS